jgi:NAD(P)-dependent dehydrogenase (short-subunit alcohol dehydrogenase family)
VIDPQPLKGKAAIVTGAGGGIGRAYSRGLAEAGAAVVLADIKADTAQAAADALVSDGFDALAVQVDVTDEASVNAMEMWHRTLDVNLTGPFLCTRAVVPYMREKGYGKIINQSSGGAWLGSAHYGLTKLGIVSMTISLAKELAKDGIRVNAIAPGWTNTEAGLSTTTPEVRAAIARSIPFPFGEPEDLVGGLVYLASAASDWVTGHTLNIDGGWIPRT